MRSSQLSPARLISRSLSLVFLMALLVITSTSVALAQSGRRTPKQRELPPVPAAPEAATPPTPVSQPQQPTISLIVGYDKNGGFMSMPYGLREAVMRGAVGRFRESTAVTVETHADMNRGDAVRRAKAETTAFVVWLEVDIDSMNSARTRSGGVDPDSLYVHFIVFAPTTAKSKADGRVYPNSSRRGPVSIGLPIPTGRSIQLTEYLLQQAGEEAADRVLRALNIALPSGSRP